ncbi:Zinc-regulated outer membrane receptor [Methylophaga lonarensis MPL]|uniref:Zinc-regulated outer membrane receptor n=1 Tax=Methylophaga lonarensis MPL TaxID=1286106 RepID=M7PSL7_9GAMM|nr:TonB-dependent receptor [Methylophaga lonarensis]EMR13444.1 Zinc-regulated outer membrane receptor [Methylophaga lonarensis MPL]
MYAKKPLALLVAAALSPVAFSVTADENVDFQRLIVTSDPLGNRTADEIVQPVTVLAGDELDQRRAGTLGEVLEGLPGVTNADFGPGVGRPVIRGLQGSRIQMLEDGLSTADISGEGADHMVAIDPARADQIEVFRGPSTLLYGSGAAGGVVNVRSNRFSPEFGESARVEGDLSYGFNGHDRQGRLGLELPATSNLVFRADLSGRKSSDFDIKGYQERGQRDGRRNKLNNSEIENNSHAFSSVFTDTWGFVGLGYSYYDSKYEIPDILTGEGDEELEFIRAKQDRFDLRSEFNNPFAGFETARLKIAHTRYRQKEIANEFEDGVFDEREVEAEFRNRESDLRFELVHNPIGMWQGVIGLQFNDREFRSEGEGHGHGHGHGDDGFYVRNNDTRTWGLFVLEERPTDFGRIELAARLEQVRSNPKSLGDERDIHLETDFMGDDELEQDASLSNRRFTALSLSAGTIIDVDHAHHLRFALTRSQRAPSPEQLYAFGRHAAAGTVEVGDPRLKKETYTNFEVGFDRHQGMFRYDLTAFFNHAKDFIYPASRLDDNGDLLRAEDSDDQLVFNEQANARFYGLEFAAVADVIEGPMPVSLRFSGDYVRGKLNSGGDLPRISPMRLGFGVDTRYQNVKLSLDYQRVFKQSKTADLEDNTSGYNLVSADVVWSPQQMSGTHFYLKGRNLLNEDGRRHTSFRKDDAPIIGRAIFAGVRFDFGG